MKKIKIENKKLNEETKSLIILTLNFTKKNQFERNNFNHIYN